jgi:hypothetical protein
MKPIESDDESLDDDNDDKLLLPPFDGQQNGVLLTKEADFCRHSKQTSRCSHK